MTACKRGKTFGRELKTGASNDDEGINNESDRVVALAKTNPDAIPNLRKMVSDGAASSRVRVGRSRLKIAQTLAILSYKCGDTRRCYSA